MMSASRTRGTTSSAVGIGGSVGPTITFARGRRSSSALSGTGRVTTIVTGPDRGESVTGREDTSDNVYVPRRRQREREGRTSRTRITETQPAAPGTESARTPSGAAATARPTPRANKPARAQRRSNYAWHRRIPWVAVAGLAVAVVAVIFIARNLGVGENAGRYVPGGGVGDHVPGGRPIAYPSYPPTSGQHADSPTTWGFHTDPIADEVAVHNLEHGGVVISQNNISADDLGKLRALLTSYPKDRYGEVKIVIRPYDKIPAGTFVLTAWNWIDDGYKAYDDVRVKAFLDAHLNKCCE